MVVDWESRSDEAPRRRGASSPGAGLAGTMIRKIARQIALLDMLLNNLRAA
jgi:hypothetical protein